MGNLSILDRIVRIILGLIIGVWAYAGTLSSIWTIILLIVGILLIIEGIIGWCGVYSIFGISTKKSIHQRISKKDIQKAVEEHMVNRKEEEKNEEVSKKSTTKKSTSKKTATKKTITKKTTSKKVPTKKTTTKKISTKTTTKKSTTKKTVTKKSNR